MERTKTSLLVKPCYVLLDILEVERHLLNQHVSSENRTSRVLSPALQSGDTNRVNVKVELDLERCPSHKVQHTADNEILEFVTKFEEDTFPFEGNSQNDPSAASTSLLHYNELCETGDCTFECNPPKRIKQEPDCDPLSSNLPFSINSNNCILSHASSPTHDIKHYCNGEIVPSAIASSKIKPLFSPSTIKTETESANSSLEIPKQPELTVTPRIVSSYSMTKANNVGIAFHIENTKIISNVERFALKVIIIRTIQILDRSVKVLEESTTIGPDLPAFTMKPCQICVFTASKYCGMFNHVLDTHELSYHCQSCECKMMNPFQLQQHLVDKHNLNASYGNLSLAVGEILTESKKIQFVYSCIFCDKTFCGSESLFLFQNIVKHTEKHSICKICGSKFTCNEDLIKHSAHNCASFKILHCSFCGLQFRRLKMLQDHIESHCSFKNIDSRECNIYYEKIHNIPLYIHSGIQNYFDCPYCPIKIAETGWNFLCKHISTHKSMLCALCSDRFVAKNETTTLGENIAVCEACINTENCHFKFNPKINLGLMFGTMNAKLRLSAENSEMLELERTKRAKNVTSTCSSSNNLIPLRPGVSHIKVFRNPKNRSPGNNEVAANSNIQIPATYPVTSPLKANITRSDAKLQLSSQNTDVSVLTSIEITSKSSLENNEVASNSIIQNPATHPKTAPLKAIEKAKDAKSNEMSTSINNQATAKRPCLKLGKTQNITLTIPCKIGENSQTASVTDTTLCKINLSQLPNEDAALDSRSSFSPTPDMELFVTLKWLTDKAEILNYMLQASQIINTLAKKQSEERTKTITYSRCAYCELRLKDCKDLYEHFVDCHEVSVTCKIKNSRMPIKEVTNQLNNLFGTSITAFQFSEFIGDFIDTETNPCFLCLYCDQLLLLTKFYDHVVNKHPSCRSCRKIFNSTNKLEKHIVDHDNGKIKFFKCWVCSLLLKSLPSAIHHEMNAHKQFTYMHFSMEINCHTKPVNNILDKYSCPYCYHMSDSKTLFKIHVASHKSIACPNCLKNYITVSNYDSDHKAKIVHDCYYNDSVLSKIYSNDVGQYQNSKLLAAGKEMFVHVFDDSLIQISSSKKISISPLTAQHRFCGLKCLYCSKNYSARQSISLFYDHVTKTHHICRICSETFAHLGDRINHEAKHQAGDITFYKCCICCIELKSLKCLEKHYHLMNHNIGSYVNSSGYTEITKYLVDSQFESPHKCPYCPFELAYQINYKHLIPHIQSHRVSCCGHCNKSFVSALTETILLPSGSPVQCTTCILLDESNFVKSSRIMHDFDGDVNVEDVPFPEFVSVNEIQSE